MGGRHPSGYIVAEYLKRSTRTLQRAAVKHVRSSTKREAFDLAPSGVYQATAVTGNTGALLPHLFTLTRLWRAVCFLWHCSRGSPRVAVSNHRCPVESGLSSAPGLPRVQGGSARRDRPAVSTRVNSSAPFLYPGSAYRSPVALLHCLYSGRPLLPRGPPHRHRRSR